MPRYVDSLVVLGESRKADDVFSALSGIFRKHNITFSPETSVIFNDLNNQEREPEVASSEEEAMKAILSWPSLGGTQYNFAGHNLIVFLFGMEEYFVDAISISTIAGNYMGNAQGKSDWDELISEIHRLLNAKRTLVDYELLSPNSFWVQEVKRIRSGVFEGEYLVDLR